MAVKLVTISAGKESVAVPLAVSVGAVVELVVVVDDGAAAGVVAVDVLVDVSAAEEEAGAGVEVDSVVVEALAAVLEVSVDFGAGAGAVAGAAAGAVFFALTVITTRKALGLMLQDSIVSASFNIFPEWISLMFAAGKADLAVSIITFTSATVFDGSTSTSNFSPFRVFTASFILFEFE